MESQNEQVLNEKPSFVQSIQKHPQMGNLAVLLLPSGNMVKIREQNGNDDDILSSFSKDDLDTAGVNKFIASIIIENSFKFCKSDTLMGEKDVLNMLLNDKYFILIASRAFSLGSILSFSWDWRGDVGKVPYDEDLNVYLWDYEKPFPEEGDEDYHPYRIKPYYNLKDDVHIEATLKSGKKVRYNLMNGHSEDFLLKKSPEQRTVNVALKARKMAIWDDNKGSYTELVNFSPFSSRDMVEIRNHVNENDPQFEGISDIENPITGESLQVPLITLTDFFFPREI